MPGKLTKEQILRRFRIAHGWKYEYDFSTYKNTKTKMKMFCPEHGEFWQRPEAHMAGRGCDKCARVIVKQKLRDTREIFIEKANKLHKYKYDYSKVVYTKSIDPIIIICPIHGSIITTPVHHLNSAGCPKCGKQIANSKTRSSITKFIEKANRVHHNKYDYSKSVYVNNRTKVEIICPKHGSFFQTPHGHLSGKGCPACFKRNTQIEIFYLLKDNFPKEDWIWEYKAKWLGLQSIDIMNERIKLAIEYNGKQHYTPVPIFGGERGFELTKQRDLNKQEKIRNNGYTLYVIPYNEYNKEKIINDIKTFLNYENTKI